MRIFIIMSFKGRAVTGDRFDPLSPRSHFGGRLSAAHGYADRGRD